MANIATLLAPFLQQISAEATGVLPPDEEPLPVRPDGIINVNASNAPPNVDTRGPEPPFMGNERYLDEVAMTAESAPERSGLFGTRGTLRNILGVLGDAFLVQGGADPVYAPQRERERLSDAMVGMTNGDEAYRAAVERAAYVDPAVAATMYDNYLTRDIARQRAENNRFNYESLDRKRDSDIGETALTRSQRLLGAVTNDAELAMVMRSIQQQAAAEGVTMEMLGIDPSWTLDEATSFANGEMTVNQQRRLPLEERRVATGEYNSESQRISATRPRAAARPRSQTELEYFQELEQVPAAERSVEETQWLQDYTGQYSRGARTQNRVTTPATTPAPAARPGIRIQRIN